MEGEKEGENKDRWEAASWSRKKIRKGGGGWAPGYVHGSGKWQEEAKSAKHRRVLATAASMLTSSSKGE